MKMARLQEFGIPPAFIERWTATIGPELLDWQADAVRQFDLFGNGSLIVMAPTSSGKTFLAEMAATAALTRRRKVVYVAPLKALVAQKYRRFREVFASPPLGFRVVVSTRDQRADDARLRRGDFDVAVTVYEKWHSLLVTHLDLLATVDLVILDEPQLLGDPKRGPVVAAILDAMAAAAQAPRVLLLTAHLPQAKAVAAYLRAPVQTVHRRPVELRLGVLHEGRFHFREHNSSEIGDEPLPWDTAVPEAERPLVLLNTLAERGERILVFCPSKAECHRRAGALAERRMAGDSLNEDECWQLESGPGLAAPLAGWLTRGVGVHHADLTRHQRALVESLFVGGRISVLFCTGTLAWGIHLPATTVFVDAEKYSGGAYAGRVLPVPLERLEFAGMAGRAGRLGLGRPDQIGRGILWGRTPCEADLLWQAYIAPETDTGGSEPRPYRSPDKSNGFPGAFPAERRLLDWIVSGLTRSLDEARALADRSPFGQDRGGVWQYAPTVGDGVDPWAAALDRLIATGLVCRDGDNHLFPTPRGSMVASSGIGIDTAAAVVRALTACSDFDPALWSAFFSTLPEAADARLMTNVRRCTHGADPIAALWRARFGEEFVAAIERRFVRAPEALTVHFPNAAAQGRAMLTALVLDDWAGGRPTPELEHEFRLPIGRLEPVADTISWIFETTAALATTLPETAFLVADLQRAAFETRHGVRQSASALIEALATILPRQTLLDLIARGWDHPAVLASRAADDLAGLTPGPLIERILQRCRRWVQAQREDRSPSDTNNTPVDSALSTTGGGEVSMSPILCLDGAACRARMSVQLAGRTVMLRAKSFKYLLALAAARLLTRDGWIAKHDIETGENQIKYLYQLRRELSAAGQKADGLIENDGGGHYRLTLPPQAIRFDLPRLLAHDDWDIRSRAEQLAAAGSATAAA
ncbi:MAG: DEAD/DEAH box helicase [Candidatus Zixiibacteriota bacterium]